MANAGRRHLIGAGHAERPGTPAHRRLAGRALAVFIEEEGGALTLDEVIARMRLPNDDRSLGRVSGAMVWLYSRGLLTPRGNQWTLRVSAPAAKGA